MSVQGQSLLLSLPLELRLLIFTYHYQDTAVRVRSLDDTDVSGKPLSQAVYLMQTCRQILHEASPIFYDWTRFNVKDQVIRHFYSPSHAHDTDSQCCLAIPRGLRDLEVPPNALNQIGYDFNNPGRWVIRRPFDQVRHLIIDVSYKYGLPFPIEGVLPARDKSGWSHARTLKLMAESFDGPFKISIRLSFSDCWLMSGCFVLDLDDPKQTSTWTCGGFDLPTYYGYTRDFLQDWGLSRDQIKSLFMKGNFMNLAPTDEEYEILQTTYEERAGFANTAAGAAA